jgi:hypothetical protein
MAYAVLPFYDVRGAVMVYSRDGISGMLRRPGS